MISAEVKKVLGNLGWNIVGDVEEQGNEYCVEIENHSPVGEDLVDTIWFDGTDEGFVKGVRELADNYDPDEHAELYVGMRGEGGVPRSIRTLIDDADAIGEMYEKLADALEEPQRVITVEELINRLENIKENSESFITEDEPESIWRDDVEALDAAIGIIKDYKKHTWVGCIALP